MLFKKWHKSAIKEVAEATRKYNNKKSIDTLVALRMANMRKENYRILRNMSIADKYGF